MRGEISLIAGLCLLFSNTNSAVAKPVEYRLNPQNHYVMRCSSYLPGSADDQVKLRDQEVKLSLTGESQLVNTMKCSLWDGQESNFTLTVRGSSGAMVNAVLSYPSDPSMHTVGYFFKSDLVPTGSGSATNMQTEGSSESSKDVLDSIKMRIGENVAKHTLAYSVRHSAKVVLTDIKCPEPVPDPRYNGGKIAFLLFDRESGSLPGCYITGTFGGIGLKWANGSADSVRDGDLHFTARGTSKFGRN